VSTFKRQEALLYQFSEEKVQLAQHALELIANHQRELDAVRLLLLILTCSKTTEQVLFSAQQQQQHALEVIANHQRELDVVRVLLLCAVDSAQRQQQQQQHALELVASHQRQLYAVRFPLLLLAAVSLTAQCSQQAMQQAQQQCARHLGGKSQLEQRLCRATCCAEHKHCDGVIACSLRICRACCCCCWLQTTAQFEEEVAAIPTAAAEAYNPFEQPYSAGGS
jgi:hypothetical protein